MKMIFGKKNSPFGNMKSYLDTHLRVVHVVLIASEDVMFLGPFFSTSRHSRPNVSPASNEGYLEEVEIMGLKIQNNFFIPILQMQVGSGALVTLRHSFAHFEQICIALGSILVNLE
jgi:hypothetical protein